MQIQIRTYSLNHDNIDRIRVCKQVIAVLSPRLALDGRSCSRIPIHKQSLLQATLLIGIC